MSFAPANYRSLFSVMRLKPKPQPGTYLPDPLRRDPEMQDQEEPETDLNGKLEAARKDWRDGRSMGDLFGRTAFTLQRPVGRGQPNRPGDVFKVQALLHREGYMDADKTEGPTGFWGLCDHEAIQRFQKDQGLTSDGFMNPEGETIRRLASFYPEPAAKPPAAGIVADPQRRALPPYVTPILPMPGDEEIRGLYDPDQEVRRNILEAAGSGPASVLARLLNDDPLKAVQARLGSGTDVPASGTASADEAPSQVADAGKKPAANKAPASEPKSALPPLKLSGTLIEDDKRFPSRHEAMPEKVPDYKSKTISEQDWTRFREAVHDRAPSDPVKQRVIGRIYAEEGGAQWNIGGTQQAYAGFTKDGLSRATNYDASLQGVELGPNMTPAQIAAAYDADLDSMAQRYGGWEKVASLKDEQTVYAMADVLLREDNAGAEMIKRATNDTLESIPQNVRRQAGLPDRLEDGDDATKTMAALKGIDGIGLGGTFRGNLADLRDAKRRNEKERNDRNR